MNSENNMENIITQLKATFDSITEIKEVYAYPLQGDPKKFPAIIFYPESMDNSFETQNENFKIYNFIVFLSIKVSGTDVENAFGIVLPKIHDKVCEVIDEQWNLSTIDGHRCWSRVSTSNISMSDENAGAIVTAQLRVQIKLLTNN